MPITRKIPRFEWVRLALMWRGEPGHHWLYNGPVRRDTFSVRGCGVVLLAMPKREHSPANRNAVRREVVDYLAYASKLECDPTCTLHEDEASATVDLLMAEPDLLRRLAAVA